MLYKKYVKRILDVIFSLILSVFAAILLVPAVLLTKLGSSEPVFFRQERPGYGGRVFTIYKLRTMNSKRDSEDKLLPDVERTTKTGSILRKLSIDELPQLLNILRGEMSFIGPRPLLVQYLPLYTKEQMRRHEVLPGITGWAQVNGRNSISWEEKFKLDVWYVDNISFLLDMKIVALTITNLFRRSGINNSSGNTMPVFRGTAPSEDVDL